MHRRLVIAAVLVSIIAFLRHPWVALCMLGSAAVLRGRVMIVLRMHFHRNQVGVPLPGPPVAGLERLPDGRRGCASTGPTRSSPPAVSADLGNHSSLAGLLCLRGLACTCS